MVLRKPHKFVIIEQGEEGKNTGNRAAGKSRELSWFGLLSGD